MTTDEMTNKNLYRYSNRDFYTHQLQGIICTIARSCCQYYIQYCNKNTDLKFKMEIELPDEIVATLTTFLQGTKKIDMYPIMTAVAYHHVHSKARVTTRLPEVINFSSDVKAINGPPISKKTKLQYAEAVMDVSFQKNKPSLPVAWSVSPSKNYSKPTIVITPPQIIDGSDKV